MRRPHPPLARWNRPGSFRFPLPAKTTGSSSAQPGKAPGPTDRRERLALQEEELALQRSTLDAEMIALASQKQLLGEQIAQGLLSKLDTEFAVFSNAIAQHLETILMPLLEGAARTRAIKSVANLIDELAAGRPMPVLHVAGPAELTGPLKSLARMRGLEISVADQDVAELTLDIGRTQVIASLDAWRDALRTKDNGT